MDPITASLLVGGIGAGLNAAGGAMGGKAQAESNRYAIDQQRAQSRDELAFKESLVNPFRHQMFQAQSLGRLGMMGQPANLQLRNGRYVPNGPGGFQPSPELLGWLSMLQQNIAAGSNQARSAALEGPAAYGTTSVLDLTDPNNIANPRGAMAYAPRHRRPIPGSGGGAGETGEQFYG